MSEDLEDRIGEISDAVAIAAELHSDLSQDSDLEEVAKLAKSLLDDLQTAETVETIEDFTANIKAAQEHAVALGEALKAAQVQAKKSGTPETLEVVKEAKGSLRNLTRELNELSE